ncbi:MAG: LPS ABC transporter substrate-binding protein LptA [Cohaesibacteraceae bacterium]|nr:LPS ABC transporter substrate-binding protein LptA [Cohaesibacteraceae bacterium]MBL4875115.1 LPS ABC transporter substrate-binding protein LptA [Cohaesibacteraceae bacterium]
MPIKLMRKFIFLVSFIFLAVLDIPEIQAQGFGDVFGGAQSDPDAPIAISADSLKVSNSQKIATFTGNVIVKQGKLTLETPSLTVHYAGDAAKSQSTGQSITRLEAHGGVFIKNGDQRARGNRGIVDFTKDIITLIGKVSLGQGDNIVQGEKLIVHMKTGEAELFSGKRAGNSSGSGRVQGLFLPKKRNK